MEGFAQELAPLGVQSLLVEPGMLRTDFRDQQPASFGSIDIPAMPTRSRSIAR